MIIIRIGLGITTARGSSLAFSNDTNAKEQQSGIRHPIQFAHSTAFSSTLDSEYDFNAMELQAAPPSGQDYANGHEVLQFMSFLAESR